MLDQAQPLVWLFVSAVAVPACLQSRRWMHAVRSMRILPIGPHHLALVLYASLVAPAFIACLVATIVWESWPWLGIHVPAYLFVAFFAAPVTLVPWQRERHAASATSKSVQQWTPVMQQAAWPMLAGSLCSFGGPGLMPAWYLTGLMLFAVGIAVAGYFALLAGIRSPEGFERHGGPLGASP
jgi:hypothetical protein